MGSLGIDSVRHTCCEMGFSLFVFVIEPGSLMLMPPTVTPRSFFLPNMGIITRRLPWRSGVTSRPATATALERQHTELAEMAAAPAAVGYYST